jgi:hypothetical protein
MPPYEPRLKTASRYGASNYGARITSALEADEKRKEHHHSPESKQLRHQLAWDMRVRGSSFKDIIAEFQKQDLGDWSPGQVYAMVRDHAKELAEAHEEAALLYKHEIHERYNLIIKESLMAWERSKEVEETSTTVDGRVHVSSVGQAAGLVQEPDVIPLPQQLTLTRKGSNGNPAFLRQAMDAMEAQRKIWGVDAPKKSDVTSDGKAVKAYIGINLDDV